ncbi:hypothetical protein FRC02_008995 [Tulasnella sp. 418]|nr:hypothetical protein FRC02_008995 [Tulasnella sp. 418]
MREVDIDEQAARTWRKKIGEVLRGDLGLDDNKEYSLAQWPEGYKMYAHHKGNKVSPRTDFYLFGASHGNRYRSANEFLFHARWLLRQEDDETPCNCKYCTGQKLQRIINYNAGIGPPGPPSPHSPSPLEPSSSRGPVRRPRTTARMRVGSPLLSQSSMLAPAATGLSINRDRDSDLRSQRCFRPGEIAWCPIDPPLPTSEGSEKIIWWPCVIQAPQIKVDVRPGEGGASGYSVAQTTVYRIRLLGLSSHYIRHEHEILPWLAYRVPRNLADALQLSPRTASFKDLAAFQPLPHPLEVPWNDSLDEEQGWPRDEPNDGQHNPAHASSAYRFALSIASKTIDSWCPTDRWLFEPGLGEGQNSSTQVRFQGLWWGGERIWVGDVVRIKLRLVDFIAEGLLQPSAMADTRGLFVKINGIYLSKSSSTDSNRGIIPMFCGTLLEVADISCPDESNLLHTLNSSSNNGKVANYLPPAPIGFRWRALTPTIDDEAHFDLGVIAGRYYPALMTSPLLSSVFNVKTLSAYVKTPDKEESVVGSILSLGGLLPGQVNSFSPQRWSPSRTDSLTSAYKSAMEDNPLVTHPPTSVPLPHSHQTAAQVPEPSTSVKSSPSAVRAPNPDNPMEPIFKVEQSPTAIRVEPRSLGGGTFDDPIEID